MMSEIGEGRSLYTMDACLVPGENTQPADEFWETSFKQMTERVRGTSVFLYSYYYIIVLYYYFVLLLIIA